MTTAQATQRMLLNDRQRDAAQEPEGPIEIIGGPGSGKTHTLIARTLALLRSKVSPSHITYLTFSSRGADQTRQQMSDYIADHDIIRRLFVGTFHHYASTFLRQAGAALIGHTPSYTLWDHQQAKDAIGALVEQDPGQLTIPSKELKDFLQWHGLNRARWGEDPTPPQEAYWYQLVDLYTQEKKRQNVLDLDDLIPLAIRAMELDTKTRTIWNQIRSRHLLIDEFQDITPAQYRFMQLITGPTKSVTIATDPNQSINTWRGAEPTLLKRFRLDHNDTQVHLLRVNHRATSTLVETAATLTDSDDMTGLVNAYQEPVRPAGPPPSVINCKGSAEQLYSHIVAAAEELVENEGYTWEDMAIIYRRNQVRTSIRTILIAHHIPHTVIGDVEDSRDNNAKRAINLLSTLLNPMDTSTFARAASVEPGDSKKILNREATKTIAALANEHNLNLIESASRFLPTLRVKARTRQNLEYIVHAWHALTNMATEDNTTLKGLCHRALALVRQGQEHSYTIEADKFANRLLNMAETSFLLPNETLYLHLARFLETIKAAAYPDLQDDENDDPFTKQLGVTLCSIHGAKGLQWKAVWFVDASEHVIPGRTRPDRPEELQEEQRAFYVATTRATDRLFYCNCEGGSKGFQAQPTSFLDVLGEATRYHTI